MTKPGLTHETLQWSKQKLDEIDATLTAVEGSVDSLKSDARAEADRAIARIKAARDSFKAKVDSFRADAASAKGAADEAYAALEAEWVKVEMSFDAYLTAAKEQADVVAKVFAARAAAQREAMRTALEAVRASAREAIEQARRDIDTAIHGLAAETEKAQARLGQVSSAGAESWLAIKSGLDATRAASARTWNSITEALTKISQ